MEPLNLKVIIGSTRPGRAADVVAPWVTQTARRHGGFTVDVLDLSDWPLPFFAETRESVGDPHDPTYSEPIVKRWNARIAQGDAYLVITPEYNRSIPAVLKNAVDSVFMSFGFCNKPAAFVGYSAGAGAGIRAIEHLAHIVIEAEGVPLRNTVPIGRVAEAFDPSGHPADPATDAALRIMLDDLVWWARALKRARDDGSLPPGAFRMTMAQAAAAHGADG